MLIKKIPEGREMVASLAELEQAVTGTSLHIGHAANSAFGNAQKQARRLRRQGRLARRRNSRIGGWSLRAW